jgi:sugar lactone lactonase YvrE
MRLWPEIGVCLIVLMGGGSLAADPLLEKTDLFIAREAGYELYRIPGIVVTPRGTVLAYCEARKSAGSDWGPIDILLRRSPDQGRTWLERQTLVQITGDLPVNPVARAQKLDRPGDNTANNPVAIVDQVTGAIHFLYCLEYMRCFWMQSTDEGATWSEPVEITSVFEQFRPAYNWQVLATGPGHAIQLQRGAHAGRLVVPVWLSLGTGGHAHRPSVTATIFSDDHGITWQAGEIAIPNERDFVNPNETHLVERADGSVLLNTRSESRFNRRLTTVSPDGASGWTTPDFHPQLLEPICMAGLCRVRWPTAETAGCIAFSNPDNLARRDQKEGPGRGRDRVNLSIKLSDDDGATWSANRVLEESFSAYSDLATLPDGTLLCFYERGSTDGEKTHQYGRLTVARFNEDWVREYETTSPVAENAPLETLSTLPQLADGPAWSDLGTLYVPDVKGEQLYTWNPTGQPAELSLAREGVGRWSAAYFRNGGLYVSDNGRQRIDLLRGNELTTLHQFDTAVQPAIRPNDLVVDRSGGVYVTLTGQNQVVYITSSGVAMEVASVITPNGIILSPDGQQLYVSAYRPKEIHLFPVVSPGVLAAGRLFARMDDGDTLGADGMSIDNRGNIYCAGATAVWIWNPAGQLLDQIACPTRPINCTFGDHDLRSLYITGFGGLYRQRMRVRGIAN